jgi:predicted nucleic acid-binding protein
VDCLVWPVIGRAFDADSAQVWGRLRVANPEHELDKQIAAVARVNDLTVVTRNTADFQGTGVKLMNPFRPVPAVA